MVWERLPTAEQKERLRKDIAMTACNIPNSVVKTVQSFSYVSFKLCIAGVVQDMSMLTSLPGLLDRPC